MSYMGSFRLNDKRCCEGNLSLYVTFSAAPAATMLCFFVISSNFQFSYIIGQFIHQVSWWSVLLLEETGVPEKTIASQ